MNSLDSYYWWNKDSKDLSQTVFEYLNSLETEQSYVTDSNYKNIRLYGNLEPYSLRTLGFQRSEPSASTTQKVTLNIVQSMVDTVVSKITKNKPKPTFLTDGGDWTLQTRAKKLTQFCEGVFYATDFYAKAATAFKHACILGTGAVKIFSKDGKIHCETVLVEELKVDDTESIYGEPRQLHQTKFVHRDVLKQMFPKYEVEIDAATTNTLGASQYSNYKSQQNMLKVVESWHLPSGPEAKDGKHAICIENQTLFEDEYTKDYFPFVFFRWSNRPVGFWGQGLAEQLTGLQLEINKILRTIQISMHLVSVPKLLVEASSKVVSAHLNNKIGGIIKFAGTPPTFAPLGSIPPELFAHLERLYSKAYEIVGVSQLAAQSNKPAGLNSGKALRTYNDIETERFLDVGIRYQQAFMDASKQMIALARELSEEQGYKVNIMSKDFMKTIDWKDVHLEEDQYMMKVFPTSALSSTPEGRLQDVQELLAAGFIDIDSARDLLDFPDLQAYNNFENAGVNDIKKLIELMAEEGEYQTPEPFQDLAYGIKKIQKAYLFYRAAGAPEDRLELMRRWIADARALQKKAIAEQALEQQKLQAASTALGEGQAQTAALGAADAEAEALSPLQGRTSLNPQNIQPLDTVVEAPGS